MEKLILRAAVGVIMAGGLLILGNVARADRPVNPPPRAPYQMPSASPVDALIHAIEVREEMDQLRERRVGR